MNKYTQKETKQMESLLIQIQDALVDKVGKGIMTEKLNLHEIGWYVSINEFFNDNKERNKKKNRSLLKK